MRLLVIGHDNDGDITHVRSWQKWAGYLASADIAASPTPFIRSSEYDPDEPVLGPRSVDEAIVLEILDRAEPSLVGSDAPAQPPRDVARAVDAIMADATGFHHFGYRGHLGHSDWVEPTSHESTTQVYAMHFGMTCYYGNVAAVVHGRATVRAADRATEHHRTWHAFGAHVRMENPCARLQRAEHTDPLHGFGRRGNIVADDT